MKLSIVMPVFNERATLGQIVQRVLDVPIPLDKEIILIDDFSTDGTRELYPEVRELCPSRFARRNQLVVRDIGPGSEGTVLTLHLEAPTELVAIYSRPIKPEHGTNPSGLIFADLLFFGHTMSL